jgi:hypothetical protein
MGRATDVLRVQSEEAYAQLVARLAGLTQDEFLWEPVAGCWTVHRDRAGRWVCDYEEPDPEPSPFTTIAWRLVHVAQCKVMYHEYAFGPGRLRFDAMETPHTVGRTVGMLDEGQRLLLDDLAALSDDDLDAPVLTNWGETWPAWRIFWTMSHHDAHHGAEVGVLRDLYRRRGEAGASATAS